MTMDLKNVMIFLIANYPQEQMQDLSNARLTKMVYLSDWHFALNHQKQITDLKWYFDTYGPFVKDIEKTALEYNDLFVIDFGNNQFGQPKKSFRLHDPEQEIEIGKNEEITFNHIIKITSNLFWGKFINLVYSTYPVRVCERYTYLDLPELAAEYLEP